MDKSKFLSSFVAASTEYELPNGEKITLLELSAEQRNKLQILAQSDTAAAQSLIVAMACPFLSEDDIDDIKALPARDVDAMANSVLEISGLSVNSEAEAGKN